MMKINSSVAYLLLIQISFGYCFAKSDLSRKNQAFLEKHLIKNEKIKNILDKAFSQTTNPKEALNKENFTLIKNSHSRIIAIPNDTQDFIIKTRTIEENKFLRLLWPDTNIRRIENANKIRNYLKKHKLEKYVVIPKKWIYHIPNTGLTLNDYNYLIVAEKLDIKKIGFHKFTQQQQNIIFRLIKKLGLFDPNKGNIFLTSDGRIAFIDTEPPRRIKETIPLWKELPLVKFLYKKDNAMRGVRRFSKELKEAIGVNS